MSPRSWQNRVDGILACDSNIQDYTTGMTFEPFLGDPRTVRAVAFEFTTIGEAPRAVSSEIQKKFPDITWAKMHGIRNILVHEYFRLDEEILWEVSQKDIPSLVSALEDLLRSQQ